MRIMYIDDEEALVHLSTRVLQKMGHVVDGFTDAAEALEAFRANPARVDLVVTDLNMPATSGLETARKLMEIRPEVRIVITSGYVDEELIERARELGIQHVLYKSSTVKEFCDSIHQVLQAPPA